MENTTLEQLKYPIGKFTAPDVITGEQLKSWIKELEQFPAKLNAVAKDLSNAQLALTYRPDGWTVSQVIHHLADSHANAYIRIKLALTEENPVIKPYFESRWAETEDAKKGDIQGSLLMLEGMHMRWVACFKTLSMEDFSRTYFHPEHEKTFDLKYIAGMYAWHCAHHLAHIQNAIG